MKAQTVAILVITGIYFSIAAIGNYSSERRITAHIDAELQTLKPVMSEGRCFIVKVPDGGL